MADFDPKLMGDKLRPAYNALLHQLLAGVQDRERLRDATLQPGTITAKTFDTLLYDLATFGLITRLGRRHSQIRLTTLGRKWLQEHHQEGPQ